MQNVGRLRFAGPEAWETPAATTPERGGPDEARAVRTEAWRAQESLLAAAEAEMAGDTPMTIRQIADAHRWLDLWRTRLLSAQMPLRPRCPSCGTHPAEGDPHASWCRAETTQTR